MNRGLIKSLGTPLVNKDPLDPEFTLLGKYHTPFFVKEISQPNEENELIEIFKNDTYSVLSDLEGLALHFSKMKGVLKENGRAVIMEYLKGNRNFEWSECLANLALEKRSWPAEWSRLEKMDCLAESREEIFKEAERLKSRLIAELCISGDLIIYDLEVDGYASEIEYYGLGFYFENELCGNGGIHFFYNGDELCYLVTWLS
jgi:hypothetical protein